MAICRWFADRDMSVESLHAATDGETVHDVFLVTGSCTAAQLEHHLSRSDAT